MINYLLFIACIVVLHMSSCISSFSSRFFDPLISLVYLFIVSLALFDSGKAFISRVLITFRRIRKQNRVDEPEFFYIAVYAAGMYVDLD